MLHRVIAPGSYLALTQSCREQDAAGLGLGLDADVALRLLDAAKR